MSNSIQPFARENRFLAATVYTIYLDTSISDINIIQGTLYKDIGLKTPMLPNVYGQTSWVLKGDMQENQFLYPFRDVFNFINHKRNYRHIVPRNKIKHDL